MPNEEQTKLRLEIEHVLFFDPHFQKLVEHFDVGIPE